MTYSDGFNLNLAQQAHKTVGLRGCKHIEDTIAGTGEYDTCNNDKSIIITRREHFLGG